MELICKLDSLFVTLGKREDECTVHVPYKEGLELMQLSSFHRIS